MAKKKKFKKFKKFDVVCPSCKGVFHETTELYDPKVTPRPNMCVLKEPYKSWMWEDFGQLGSSALGDMCCPGCGYPYILGCGRLLIRPQAPAEGRIEEKEEIEDIEPEPVESVEVPKKPVGVSLKNNEPEIDEPPPGQFMCPVCGESYDYRIALIAHMKTHNEAEFKDLASVRA